MLTGDQQSPSQQDQRTWPKVERRQPEQATTSQFRVAAFPVVYAITDDVILNDQTGRPYLLTHESPKPLPLDPADVDSLGMFYEPSQDYSWHTLPELRRILYGVDGTVEANP